MAFPQWEFLLPHAHESIYLKPTKLHSSVQLFYFKYIMNFIQLHVALIIKSPGTDSSLYSSLNICIPIMELCPFFSLGASLRDDINKYFWFHHSQGDTMTVQDPKQMNLCAAVWTVVSYVIADMEDMLPR